MKKIFTLLAAIIITSNLLAQAPQKMSYQAVIRNASNNLVTNAPVKMRISILQGSTTGSSVYSELHSATTNANGLVSIEIGEGTSKTGNFSSINWGNGTYYLKTETDPNNGTNYTITGTSQLLSVPYALESKNASSAGDGIKGILGDTLTLNNGEKYVIPGIKKVGNPPSTINNGLVAYYPFNGNANDESGNNFNGQLFGNVTLSQDRKSNPNSCYNWPSNGTGSDYISIPNISNILNQSNSISFSCWMFMDGGYIGPRVITQGETCVCANNNATGSRTFTFYLGNVGIERSNPIPTNQWVHLLYVSNGNTGEAKLYINGVLNSQASTNPSTTQQNSQYPNNIPWNIGRKSIPAYDQWGGKLDEIRIYNRALTQEEITYLANN
ncbi:MAG: LamG domain-containing protein [Bacteroidota bacterium]|jgi:hypothetical protein